MTDPGDAIKATMRAYAAAKRRADHDLTALHEAIRAAAKAGMKQAEIVRLTGYTREHIRQITKD